MEPVVDLFEPFAGGVGTQVQVRRTLAPGLVNGRPVNPPTRELVTIVGSFQPLGARELLLLPEGMRTQGAAKFFTTSKLYTVETSTAKAPDVLLHQGSSWQVMQVDDWTDTAGYYRVLLTRMGT